MSLLNEASFLVTPNSYKEDKLHAAIPTNGDGDMTFTRESTATRVNEAGLVELVPYNLSSRSEEFDNAAWTAGNVTATASSGVSPDGTNNAYLINVSVPSAHYLRQTITVTASTAYVFSFWAKRGTITNLTYSIYNMTAGANILSTDYYSQTNSSTWTRINIPFTTPVGCTSIGVYPIRDTPATGTFYLYGAQLVEGSSALTYQKTVDRLDIPRIDYTGGGCPSILLEPQRTNLLTYSEQFDNAAWVKQGTSSVSGNTTIAPDGSLTADTLSGATGTDVSGNVLRKNVSGTVDSTLSIYIKSLGSTSFTIYIRNGLSGAVQSQSITPNGTWQRVTLTSNPNNGQVFFGNTDGDVAIWGAQLEAGAYPTSYIPTTTIKLARNADVINRNDIYTNNLITAAGGTWFVDLINNVVMSRDTSNLGLFIADSSDGITGNVISLRNNSSLSPKRLTINKRIAGSQTQIYITTTDHVKVAIKWNGTTADVFENGIKVVSATSFTATDMEFFSGTGSDVSKYIKQMALFPTPLHDDECIALTTL
jgi:hypothetical protein